MYKWVLLPLPFKSCFKMKSKILFLLILLVSPATFAQTWSEFDGTFGLEEGLVTKASQLYSNHKEPKEGSYEGLLDADFTTFFHSLWSKENPDGEYAYLQVDLGDKYKQVGICYAKRANSSKGNPTKIRVFATNDTTRTWTGQGFINCTYTYNTTAGDNFAGKTLIELTGKYRFIRLQVEETQGNPETNKNLYFFWSEFRAFDPEEKPAPTSPYVHKLVVTELQTSNLDMFLGPTWNYDGWIEFYNPTDEEISLKKCYVSDDPAIPQKYPIMGTTKIPSKGYGLIWLGEHEDNPTSQVQTKLDADGGTIYIFNANDSLTHTINYPAAFARTSWAMKADSTWGYTSNPTPGAANATTGYGNAMLEAPEVDIPSQIFQGKLHFSVDIPAGYKLRYTTDGRTPTLEYGSTSISGNFSLDNKTGIYRFRFFKNGMLPSAVTTRSFICSEQKYTVPVAFVVSNPDHFYNDTIGVMVKGTNGISGRGQSSPCNWNRDWDRPVNFEYLLPDGEVAISQEGNLIIAGGWSRAYEPHTFKIKSNKVYYGKNSLDYPFFSAKPYLKHKTIQFRSGGNDRSCRFTDAALQTIVQSSGIDVDGLSYQPTVHFLNGDYKGVINLREPNNKHFVYANRGWDDDEIDQFEYSTARYNQVCGTKDALNELRELTKHVTEGTWEEICKRLDIDEFINYMATEIYLAPSDWLGNNNNCKGYRHRADDGKFRLVQFDLDSFGGSNGFNNFKETKTILNHETGQTEEFDIVNIFIYLCNHPQFRKKFADTFCLVAGSIFEPDRVQQIVDSLSNNIDDMMALEGLSTASSANKIKSTLNAARQSSQISNMANFTRLQLTSTSSQTVSLETNIGEARLFVNDIPVPTNKFSGKLFAPITLRASAPAGYKFIGWKEGTLSDTDTIFAAGSTWRYYDQGSLDGEAWQSTNYDDTSWAAGQAPFGYANKDLGFKTIISYGGDSRNKYPTSYYRAEVNVPNCEILNYMLHYRVDDGFVVYVNGVEAARNNLPDGDITFSTFTKSSVGDWGEGDIKLPKDLFHTGSNTIAVEVHNTSATSTDMFWDASLYLYVPGEVHTGVICEDPVFELEKGTNYALTAYYEREKEGESEERNLPIRINEVSAANTVFANEYYKRNDWVELYNTTDSILDLAGMYLTDNVNKPHKYQIPAYLPGEGPSTLIAPHGYKIIWCDKQADSLYLHASFKLSAEEGDIMLTDADELWTDTLHYVAHDGNHSVGLYPDGGRLCYLLSRPTIEEANQYTSYSEFLYAHIIPVIPTEVEDIDIDDDLDLDADAWYDLSGRQLNISGNSKPTHPGIYIHNGKKVLISL